MFGTGFDDSMSTVLTTVSIPRSMGARREIRHGALHRVAA